jgi:hypothetical protein
MTPTTERTQYVLPGAERIAKPKRRQFKADGNQLVIPGAERISTGAHLARLADKPITLRLVSVGCAVRRCLVRFKQDTA